MWAMQFCTKPSYPSCTSNQKVGFECWLSTSWDVSCLTVTKTSVTWPSIRSFEQFTPTTVPCKDIVPQYSSALRYCYLCSFIISPESIACYSVKNWFLKWWSYCNLVICNIEIGIFQELMRRVLKNLTFILGAVVNFINCNIVTR